MSAPLPLDGLTVVVTGTISGLDRAQAAAAVTALGGKPSGSVSGKTHLVVVGDGAGVSKMAKVRQHNLHVLPGEAFAALVADPAAWDGTPVGAPLDTDPEEEVPAEPFVMPDHMVGLASATGPDGATEYRLWCRCGHAWRGQSTHERPFGCPADPNSVAAARLAERGDTVDLDHGATLATLWGLRRPTTAV